MITALQLQGIRDRAASTRIYRDRFGGRFVLRRDSITDGQSAIIDRAVLLEYLDEITKEALSDARK